MGEFKVEQLVVLKKNGGFCNNSKSFNQLLQSNSDIVITGKKIKYKKNLEVNYNLICNDVENKEQRFFQISLIMKDNADNLDLFVDLQKSIRSLISKAGGTPETLTDDVSTFYANKAYPYIHRVENLLRKLITNFMIRKIGSSYVKEASPIEFKTAIDSSKRSKNGYMNAMYQVDFKHLADFLFKPYTRKKEDELYLILKKARTINDLNLDELKEFVPRSNWHRYFYKEVNCEDTFLSKKWGELYDLRCMIAHNAIVNKATFTRILDLIQEVENILQSAVDKLDKVDVPEEEQDLVAENVVSNINDSFANFISQWNYFESILTVISHNIEEIYSTSTNSENIKNERTNPFIHTKLPAIRSLRILEKHKLATSSLLNELHEIRIFRNSIMHGVTASPQNLLRMIDRLNFLIVEVKNIQNQLVSRQCIVTIESIDNKYKIKYISISPELAIEEIIIPLENFESIEDIKNFLCRKLFMHKIFN